MPDGTGFTATSLMKEGFRALVRPPFVWLVGLAALATLATSSIRTEDVAAFVGVIVVSLISAYTSIGLTLAAAEQGADPNPELWIRAAFKRRCLIRSFLTLMFVTILTAAGLLALVVPGFIVGAAVALAEIAAILENHQPGDAVRRSLELTKPARRPVGVVYGLLVLVPGMGLQLAVYLAEIEAGWLRSGAQVATLIAAAAAQIGLTSAFLALGGRNLPRATSPEPQRTT